MSLKKQRFEELKPCRKNGSSEDRINGFPDKTEYEISGLPDEILLYICSFLSLKEAVCTSILSRRWRYLCTSLPRLNFPKENRERVYLYENTYKRMVNQVLNLYKAQNLQELSIHFPFMQNSSSDIDRWAAFAVAKGVSRLELNFYILGTSYQRNYSMPDDLFDETKGMELYLKLKSAGFFSVPTSFLIAENRLKSLKQLFLRSVDVTDQLFGIILSNCSSLECLCLHGSQKLISAKNTGHRQLKLKCLEIYYCKNLENIQLSAPNLIEFKYQGEKVNISIKDARQFVNLSIISYRMSRQALAHLRGEYFVFGQFSAYLSQLEFLMLDVRSFMETIAFHKIPLFRNLKQLSLYDVDCSPQWRWYSAAFSLINASPLLHRLELHLPFGHAPLAPVEETEPAMSPHHNLKEVLISCFADDTHTDFVTSVLDKAVSLKKIEMTRSWLAWFAGDVKFVRPKDVADADHKKCPCQLLPKLPPNVELSIF